MAHKWVSSVRGSDSNNGTTQTLAWATIKKAASTALATDTVWVERNHVEADPSAHVVFAQVGTITVPFRVMGTPRASSAGTANFTQGSTAVTNSSVSMAETKHEARYITGPDGNQYLIEWVVSTSAFTLATAYVGASATGGAFTLQADSDLTEYLALTAGDGRTEAAWDAQDDTLPTLNDSTGLYYISSSAGKYLVFKNFQYTAKSNLNYLYLADVKNCVLEGILFKTTGAVAGCIMAGVNVASLTIRRCCFKGNSVNGRGILLSSGAMANLFDCCFNNMASGINSPAGAFKMTGCNFGVVTGNTADIVFTNVPAGVGVMDNCKLNSSSPYTLAATNNLIDGRFLKSENDQKVRKIHKEYFLNSGYSLRNYGTGSDVHLRSGGGDSVMECLFNLYSAVNAGMKQPTGMSSEGMANLLFEDVFDDMPAVAKSYRYYVQSVGALTTAQLWLEVDYISGYYGDTNNSVRSISKSTSAISARADADDWTQYLEVANVTPATTSRVRVRIFAAYYHAANKFYIDTKEGA